MHVSILQGGINRALFCRVRCPIGMRMMQDPVHGRAAELIRRPPEKSSRGGIDERGTAPAVDTVDAVARGFKDQLIVPAEFMQGLLDTLAFRNVPCNFRRADDMPALIHDGGHRE